ncbi:MAG TPA: preprotein translocase subunit SecY [Microthrixaceae bacterium]|nr:preprotein translocase subunit SecY [Microthrixaceae bacterium]
MIKFLRNVFGVRELRGKVLFTLGILALYRLGSYIPAPGIDQNAVNSIRNEAESGGGVLAFLQLFSGKALTQFAIFALGIMPYITSSIIMQILTVVIPKLQQWQEQGAVGQRKITQWTRYLTVGIAVIQSTGLVFLFHNGGGGLVSGSSNIDLVPNFGLIRASLIVTTLTAGTALLMWMGESITQRGIGNGMSLIIFSSVVSSLPAVGGRVKAEDGWPGLIFVIALVVFLVLVVVFIEQGQRRIPVQFAKRVVGRRMYGGQSTYIPLKVNMAGVVPIIFASAVLNLPVLLAQVLPQGEDGNGWGASVTKWIDDNLRGGTGIWYLLFYGMLIFAFAFFYTAIAFDPVQQADNLRKQGGFIPGIRPGPQTERYLAKVLNRITVPGGLFITALALIPAIAISFLLGDSDGSIGLNFGGTSILIAVGVALETMKQIDSQLMMRNYESYLKV